jgi:hypothetical protein
MVDDSSGLIICSALNRSVLPLKITVYKMVDDSSIIFLCILSDFYNNNSINQSILKAGKMHIKK